ncbi:MAG TPA: tetratricopeptide repeat protein [Pyrinomonadaceae bacterium]|nr:tetratricopeptide repeat protein [Pyrinomonadaceae bacterium]
MFIFLNLLFWYFWLFVVLIIHEFGHAIVAKIVGLKIFALIIGYGKKLTGFEIFGIPVEINLKPFNGLTYAFPTSTSWVKTRMWFYNLGGLLTHIIFISVFIIFNEQDFGSFFTSLVKRPAIFETFFLANLFLLVINAFPYKFQMPQGAYFSDGYKLFQIPFQKIEEIVALEKVHERLEAWNALRKGNHEKAFALYEKLLAENPDDMVLKHDLAIAKLKFGNYEEAREFLICTLTAKEFENPPMKMLLYNNIAWINAVIAKDSLLEEADKLSLEAYNSNPRLVNFIGTRGSVLVRLGKNVQGLELLKDAYGKMSDKRGRSENACFIAIGKAKLGAAKEAKSWLEIARKNDLDNKLIEIAEREINVILSGNA